MTDPASAEGPHCEGCSGTVEYADGKGRPCAGLRDTGPRPDSGIDKLVTAVFAFMDERVDEPHEMTPAEERLMKASREYARLSTPRTETPE